MRYQKLFSSLWSGSLRGMGHTQHVFLYMLGNSDENGVVDVIPERISDDTGLGLAEVMAAIGLLSGPDPASRTPDLEGRRIVPIEDGRPWGWILVNHEKYAAQLDRDKVREQTRLRMKKYREAHSVTLSDGPLRLVTQCDAMEMEKEMEKKKKEKKPCPVEPDGFVDFYRTYPRKEKRRGAASIWRGLSEADRGAATIGLARFISQVWPGKDREFIPQPTAWLNGRRWEDEAVPQAGAVTQSPEEVAERSRAIHEEIQRRVKEGRNGLGQT